MSVLALVMVQGENSCISFLSSLPLWENKERDVYNQMLNWFHVLLLTAIEEGEKGENLEPSCPGNKWLLFLEISSLKTDSYIGKGGSLWQSFFHKRPQWSPPSGDGEEVKSCSRQRGCPSHQDAWMNLGKGKAVDTRSAFYILNIWISANMLCQKDSRLFGQAGDR